MASDPVASLLVAGLLFLTACGQPCGEQRSVVVHGALEGANVVPPLSAPAHGDARLTLVDERDREDAISWNVHASSLSGDVTALHLHSGAPGSTGDVLYTLAPFYQRSAGDFDSGVATSYSGQIDVLITQLRTGATYIDVHTSTHPNGELRANMTNVEFADWSGYFCG